VIRACIVAAAVAVGIAAAPSRSVDPMTVPSFSIEPSPLQRGTPEPPRFRPAPVPDQDAAAPSGPRAGNDAQIGPGFFTRRNQYRGEGYSAGSSSQIQQDRRAQPGAGVNLRVPLQ